MAVVHIPGSVLQVHRTRLFRRMATMPKGMQYVLGVALTVLIAGYVILKVTKVDGADTLAIGMSSIISIFIAMQNAGQSEKLAQLNRELAKVKNQTNGMTHHVMQENRELRRAKTIVDPAEVVYDTDDEGRHHDHGQ